MAAFYLTTWLGTGTLADPFIPLGAAARPGWRVIDLRPNPAVAAGRALLVTPTRNDLPGMDLLGESLDAPIPPALRGTIATRLGLPPGSVAGATVRSVIIELLTVHGDAPGRWKKARPGRDGRVRIHLGDPVTPP